MKNKTKIEAQHIKARELQAIYVLPLKRKPRWNSLTSRERWAWHKVAEHVLKASATDLADACEAQEIKILQKPMAPLSTDEEWYNRHAIERHSPPIVNIQRDAGPNCPRCGVAPQGGRCLNYGCDQTVSEL